MSIRVNVAAAIVQDGKLLLAEFDDENGLHYNLPGGGVDAGETLYEALRREVHEETNAHLADIERLLLIWEYVPQQQNDKYGERPKVSMLFACTLQAGSVPGEPPKPDGGQIGVRWVALDELHTVTLYPELAPEILASLENPPRDPVPILPVR